MKKFILVLLSVCSFLCAKTPTQLINEGACYWPSDNDSNGDVVFIKGCPRYYTEKCDGCAAKFKTKKIDGETVLEVSWNTAESTRDGKIKLDGVTKFIVDSKDGEEALFPYETTINCKGHVCEDLQTKKVAEIINDKRLLLLTTYDPFDFDGNLFWGKTFSIDMESALYYVNHAVNLETLKEFQQKAFSGGGKTLVGPNSGLKPFFFTKAMRITAEECPSLKEKE